MALLAYIQECRRRLLTCNGINPTETKAKIPGLLDVNHGAHCILSKSINYADSELEVFSHTFGIQGDIILDLTSNPDERAMQPADDRLLEECYRQSDAPEICRDTSDLSNSQEEVIPVSSAVVEDITLFTSVIRR
jgi:hypothetical protein